MGEHARHRRLGDEQQLGRHRPEPPGPQPDLLDRLLGADQQAAAPAAARRPSDWSRRVLLPMPGSPPSRVTEPATRPPPSTRSSSSMPVGLRGAPSGSTSASGTTGAPPTTSTRRPSGIGPDLDQGPPRPALRAAPEPPRGLGPALGAPVDGSCSHESPLSALARAATGPAATTLTRMLAGAARGVTATVRGRPRRPRRGLVVGFDLDMTLIDSRPGDRRHAARHLRGDRRRDRRRPRRQPPRAEARGRDGRVVPRRRGPRRSPTGTASSTPTSASPARCCSRARSTPSPRCAGSAGAA